MCYLICFITRKNDHSNKLLIYRENLFEDLLYRNTHSYSSKLASSDKSSLPSIKILLS